jgi:hypothetical protein
MIADSWQLWFVRLHGWPVFLAIVAGVIVFMLLASVLLTRISHRSVLQNAVLAFSGVALVAAAILVFMALLTQH